ncbi:MAG: glutamate--tRNA ligase [Pseudomonadota bacterium]|nr:glutamate--tRNA ligase [Pseudomonadota bacterium]
MNSDLVTRFAPSPTGALHPGNARTALFSFLFARAANGRFLLRVEDTDQARDSAGHATLQMSDLHWLGIAWDAGPDRDDGRGPYRQSERSAIYREHYHRLEQAGHAYPCFCTAIELDIARKTQLASGQPPRYPGTCRNLDATARAARMASGRRPALRFRVPESGNIEFDDLVRGPQSFAAASLGDFLIRRADGGTVFFFCNALDDALMGVTHVLRGDDHLSNTPRQILLLQALALPPPVYGHLPLLLDPDGLPQSKRRNSVTVAQLREEGFLPDAVSNYLLRLGHHGAPDRWIDRDGLAAVFRADDLGRAPARFDRTQLEHWQREAVLRLTPEAVVDWLAPVFPDAWPRAERIAAAELLQGNLLLPGDARDWLAVLTGELPTLSAEDRAQVAEAGAGFFKAALDAFAATGGALTPLAGRLKASTGRKGAALYRPLRIALTGRHDGPELAALLAAIPAPLVRQRLASAAEIRSD